MAAGSGALAEAAQAVVEDLLKQDDGNAHVDTTAFVSLNTMDCAGLQVLTKGDDARWVDMPVLPGGVCVNVVRSQAACLRLRFLDRFRHVACVYRAKRWSICRVVGLLRQCIA